MTALGWSLLGLVALVLGSEFMVRAGTRLAAVIGIPPILIGLTFVAIGTSMPELAVGIEAARRDAGSLAVGNIAGTNTFNVLFILGLSALLQPLSLEIRTLRFDLPMMTIAAVLLLAMTADGVLTRTEGAILVSAGFGYTLLVIYAARRETRSVKLEFAREYMPAKRSSRRAIASSLAGLVTGIIVILVGADWLVEGAVDLARQMGVSDAFIGLTVVAVGTSAPELVTTVVSTLRQERDIAVGNLLGSSVYNILVILGVTALVPSSGIGVEAELNRVDLPMMAVVALVCVPVFISGRCVSRSEGAVLLCAYMIYTTYVVVTRG
jgi:cation:H+ antiporter